MSDVELAPTPYFEATRERRMEETGGEGGSEAM